MPLLNAMQRLSEAQEKIAILNGENATLRAELADAKIYNAAFESYIRFNFQEHEWILNHVHEKYYLVNTEKAVKRLAKEGKDE